MTYKELIQKIQHEMNRLGSNLTEDGDPGPLTQGEVLKYDFKIMGSALAIPTHNGETPWMDIAVKEIGEKEIYGPKDNQTILEYGRAVNYTGGKPTVHDEVPWCAIFVSWCLQMAGYKDTDSAWAGSYDSYGTACSAKRGAVITIKRSDGSTEHVTFLDHIDANGDFVCLGGNQSNQVKYSTFSKGSIKSIRWPVKA